MGGANLAFNEITDNFVVEIIDGRPFDSFGHILFLLGF